MDVAEIHVWSRCHGCGAAPIVGTRHECETCPTGPDNHLCADCYQGFLDGRMAHPAPDSLAALAPSISHRFVAVVGTPRRACDPWLTVPDCETRAPVVADRWIVRPEFWRDRTTSFFGSYAFVMTPDRGQPPLVITALHVLDALIKSLDLDTSWANGAYSGEELPRAIDHVDLYDLFAPNWMTAHIGRARAMLVLQSARTGEDEPQCQSDVAAFTIDAGQHVAGVRLASASPDVGEPVWLVANVDARTRQRTAAAVIVERTHQRLVFRFAEGRARPKYSSGAPLVNRHGDVVGINVGGGAFEGREYGHAVHAESLRAHLRTARTVTESTTLLGR